MKSLGNEGDSDSSSLSSRSMLRITKEEGKGKNKRKKQKGIEEGTSGSPMRSIQRKLSGGVSPFKAVAREQPYPEP